MESNNKKRQIQKKSKSKYGGTLLGLLIIIGSCALFYFSVKSLDKDQSNDQEIQPTEIRSLVVEQNYRELCRMNEFEKAHQVLNDLYAEYINTDLLSGESIYDNSYANRKLKDKAKYHDALDYIFNCEALYLFSLEEDQANTRILYLLSEIPIEGTRPLDGAEYNSLLSEEFVSNTHPKEVSWYKYYEFVSSYNAKCSQLLDLAIANGRKEIAKKLVAMYKEDFDFENRKKIGYAGSSYYYVMSYKSKDAAMKKYEAAFGID